MVMVIIMPRNPGFNEKIISFFANDNETRVLLTIPVARIGGRWSSLRPISPTRGRPTLLQNRFERVDRDGLLEDTHDR